MSQKPKRRRRWWLAALKLAVVAAVFVAVQGTVRDAIDNLADYQWQMHIGWLALAGLLYVAAWVPMAWFWQQVLAALGQTTDSLTALYAYFVGHLGKYVPGKALVLVIRIGLLPKRVISIRLGVASVLLETLTLMSVGAVLAAVLSLFVMRHDLRLAVAASITAVIVGLPTIPFITRRLLKRLASQPVANGELGDVSPSDQSVIEHQITARLLADGWMASILCWIVLGLSMWATLRGIGVETVHPLVHLPVLVAAVAIAVVAGFASMLPGGLGVRDLLLIQLLSPVCGEPNALIAAALWRLVSVLSELVICVILEIAKRRRKQLKTDD
jgi:uncharacterized membrane protein YbhN (UPF0104 family)